MPEFFGRSTFGVPIASGSPLSEVVVVANVVAAGSSGAASLSVG
ncbi:hypothetical protein [Mesorhizobium sp. M0902]